MSRRSVPPNASPTSAVIDSKVNTGRRHNSVPVIQPQMNANQRSRPVPPASALATRNAVHSQMRTRPTPPPAALGNNRTSTGVHGVAQRFMPANQRSRPIPPPSALAMRNAVQPQMSVGQRGRPDPPRPAQAPVQPELRRPTPPPAVTGLRGQSYVIQGAFRSGRLAAAIQPATRPGTQAIPNASSLQRRASAIQPVGGSQNAFQLPSLPPSGRGQPLPPEIQAKMETAFGTNFSDVRVHVGHQATSIGALAYTHGSNIYFAPGQYHPHTHQGQKLLAHELTHVIQQKAGQVRNPFGNGVAVVQDRALEAEADRMGKRVAAISVQRKTVLPSRGGHQPTVLPQPTAAHGVVPTAAQQAVPSRTVQKAVGFEFQTNWEVYKAGWWWWDENRQEFPKKTVLFNGNNGWQMETDGDEIEFVVAQVQENNAGRVTLNNVMQNLNVFVANMNHNLRSPNETVWPATQPYLTPRWWGSHRQVVFDTQNENIAAVPQATAGVRLDRIRRLYDTMANSPRARNELLGMYPGAYSDFARIARNAAEATDNHRPGHHNSEALKGLLTLIAQYLYIGSALGRLGTPKYMAFMMARTNFAAMFDRVPEADYYRAHPEHWINLVCTRVMGRTARNGLNSNGRVIDRELSDGATLAQGQGVHIPITRRQWLLGMLQGRDLLTAGEHPIHWYNLQNRPIYKDTRANLGHRLRGFGGLGGTLDRVNQNGSEGTILEFRGMRRNIGYADWRAFALRVFDYIRDLNESADDAVPVYPH